jgi:hypothetical protein
MAKKCSSCSTGSRVSGIEDLPWMMAVGGIGAVIALDKVTDALTKNADGTPKKNDDGTPAYLVANPKIKDLAYVAAGGAAMMYAGGNEIITGLGLGAVIAGGYSLVNSYMTPAATSGMYGMYGMSYQQPANLGAIHVPGNAGYSPSNIGRTNIPYPQAEAQKAGMKMEAV